MKNFTTLFFILVFTPIYAQWVPLNSAPLGTYKDIFCITEDIVFVVGDNGTLLKTTDGGITWVQKNSGTNQDLMFIKFATSNVGYIICMNGTLLKTIDGGENWDFISSTLISNIHDISCVNENIFYCSSNGLLYKTINGGETFQTINTPDYIEKIQFINEDIGFANGLGILLKTIDGGSTWSTIGGVDSGLIGSHFFFLNENTGFKKYLNELYKTTDGGSTYSYLTTITHSMEKLFAPSENIVWGITVALLLNGQPNYTTRGETLANGDFQRIDVDQPIFSSIYFPNPTLGYAASPVDGKIYKNTTGTMLGVNKIDTKTNILIYPNPTTTNIINISINKTIIQSFTVEITDFLGKKVFSKLYNDKNEIIINTNLFSKGIYFLTLSNQDINQTKKLIIN